MRPWKETPVSQSVKAFKSQCSCMEHTALGTTSWKILEKRSGRRLREYKTETVKWASEPPNFLDCQLYCGPLQTTLTLQYPGKSKMWKIHKKKAPSPPSPCKAIHWLGVCTVGSQQLGLYLCTTFCVWNSKWKVMTNHFCATVKLCNTSCHPA